MLTVGYDRDAPVGKVCYSASTAAFTPPATPTDCFLIGGAASVIVRVWRIWISSIQTTAGVNTWFLIKRGVANTVGTAVATTKIPVDSTFAAATATVQHYTANPTINDTIGNMFTGRVGSPGAAAAIPGFTGIFIDFATIFGSPVVLRGTAQQLAWNFGGAALPGGLSVTAGVVWSEESV